jgi:hypothetical protein
MHFPAWQIHWKRLGLLLVALTGLGLLAFDGGLSVYSTNGPLFRLSLRLFEAGYTDSTQLGNWFGNLFAGRPWLLGALGLAVVLAVCYFFQRVWDKRNKRSVIDLGWLALAACFFLATWGNPMAWGGQSAAVGTSISGTALGLMPVAGGDTEARLRTFKSEAKQEFGTTSQDSVLAAGDAGLATILVSLPGAASFGAHLALQLLILLLPAVLLLAKALEGVATTQPRLAAILARSPAFCWRYLRLTAVIGGVKALLGLVTPLLLLGLTHLQGFLQGAGLVLVATPLATLLAARVLRHKSQALEIPEFVLEQG